MEQSLRRGTLVLIGVGFAFISLFHIPNHIFPHGFDKDAPAQLFSLLIVAAIFLLHSALKVPHLNFHRGPIIALSSLVLALSISIGVSDNLWGSLFGDSGRFVGALSALALISVALFHGTLSIEDFKKLLPLYLLSIQIVSAIGVAQYFDLIELPGDAGIASTLGNSDFFSALLGTTFPLYILASMGKSKKMQSLMAAGALFNIAALFLAGPLQGYLDLAFTLVGVGIFLLRERIPRPSLSLNVRTFLGTFAVIIWAEFIFLMPFLGSAVPVLGNDIQVKIRANFWLDGMRQFFAHPFFGVGPDQYGSHYEQHRTLEDVQRYANILSNDAHSASVQTLATLGILGALACIALITFVIRSLIILWDSKKIERSYLYFIALFIFIYLTNSFISPITLSHKYLFWAIGGFLVGMVYRREDSQSTIARAIFIPSALLLAVAATYFASGQLSFLQHLEKYAADNSARIDYTSSHAIPCFMYFDAELLMRANQGSAATVELAKRELADNPRCAAAEIFLAKTALNAGDMGELKAHVYRLIEIAPTRNDTISIGMYYANRTGDRYVAQLLQREMKSLGLVYIPGTGG